MPGNNKIRVCIHCGKLTDDHVCSCGFVTVKYGKLNADQMPVFHELDPWSPGPPDIVSNAVSSIPTGLINEDQHGYHADGVSVLSNVLSVNSFDGITAALSAESDMSMVVSGIDPGTPWNDHTQAVVLRNGKLTVVNAEEELERAKQILKLSADSTLSPPRKGEVKPAVRPKGRKLNFDEDI